MPRHATPTDPDWEESDEFAAECVDLFSCEDVAYHPIGEPIPEGWELIGPLSHHHGQYSQLIRRKRPGGAWEAL